MEEKRTNGSMKDFDSSETKSRQVHCSEAWLFVLKDKQTTKNRRRENEIIKRSFAMFLFNNTDLAIIVMGKSSYSFYY